MLPISVYFKTMFTGLLDDQIINNGNTSYRLHLRGFWDSLKTEGTKIRMLYENLALNITVIENSKDNTAQRSSSYLRSSYQIHCVRLSVEIQVMAKGKTLQRQCNHQNQTQI